MSYRLLNIVRDESHRAWLVQIARRGQVLRRYFTDVTYGGELLAFDAAQQFRDAAIKRLPPATNIHLRGRRNTTGEIGVMLTAYRGRYGATSYSYIASWVDATGRYC